MADRPPLKCFTFEGCYKDDPEESGPRTDIVLAPDRDTAIRLAAKSILEDNDWTLEGQGYDTLEEYHDTEILINYEWEETGKPQACPSCTSSTVSGHGDAYECNTCGFGFIVIGRTQARDALEEQAWREIDGLDLFEKRSALGEDACANEECTADASGGEGWDGYCGNCADKRETADAVA